MKTQVLPPYANMIDRAVDLVMIYCGPRAWKLAKPGEDRVASLVFPAYRDPQEYRWPVVGKEVLVLGQGEPQMRVDYLLIELLRNGATRVYVQYLKDGDVTFYDAARSAA